MIPLYIKAIIVFLTTLSGTLFILPKLIRIASTCVVIREDSSKKIYSLMDQPDNHRKIHNSPKPRVGGLAMLMALSFSSILFVPPSAINLRGYYSAVMLLGIIGFLDDFSDLHYRWKFIAQILAATIMIHYGRNTLMSFGNLLSFGSIEFGIYFAPVTIFCTVGVINAVNMIDGLDGLAGGISLIAIISFAVLAYINEQYGLFMLGIALSGAVIGFLRYNWYPSKAFMGDAGSFFLGFSLAFLAIGATQAKYDDANFVPPIAALLILAVPVVDTLTVITKRLIKGKNPFSPDTRHFHHMLMKHGLSARGAVICILLLSLFFAVIAVGGSIFMVSEYILFIIFSVYFASYFLVSLLKS